eukprot:snap_masked-scaffold_46-processed-gene-1.57-mRNA-1 protein AED:0.04 eAED:0.04 QI:0/-1/0/1/-1/1/1/0/319
MKTKILVTGGSGLVGHGVRSALSKEGLNEQEEWIFISSKDADLRKPEECKALFEKHKPTHVLHLAAFVGGLFKNMKNNVEFFNYNLQMNSNIIACSHEYKVKKLVSCLSTCIFPDKTTYPLTEKLIHLGPPHLSNIGYSYAKRLIDVVNNLYATQYGTKESLMTSVIPTNIYGKYDNFSLEDGHVIPGLIHKAYMAKKEGKDFVIWGSGKALRQFVYNEDLGRLLVWVMREYKEVEPIILSVDEKDEVSIKELGQIVADSMGIGGNLVCDTTKADGQYKKTASNEKLRKYLPDFKFTNLKDGIQETCKWFGENYDTARK